MKVKLIACTLSLLSTQVHASIEWKVTDPFRLIDYDGTQSRFEIRASQTAYSFVVSRLSSRNQDDLPPIQKTRLINPTSDYFFPTRQNVTAKLTTPEPGDCSWKYQSFQKTAKCSDSVTFDAITQFGSGDSTLTVTSLASGNSENEPVQVVDKLILGLGDSYASGEGNPDIPAVLQKDKLTSPANFNKESYRTGRWMNNAKAWVRQDAQWFDKQCHRSMLSQHVLAALRLASLNDKQSITLLPLACSGAEVLDGVLVPQVNPPGGGERVADSQINLAIQSLCRNGRVTMVSETFDRGYTGQKEMKPIKALIGRCQGELRVPDAILLSIGGNDVGFARAVEWAVIPAGGRHLLGTGVVRLTHRARRPVCPADNGHHTCEDNTPTGEYRTKNWLPIYYEYLARNLKRTGLSKDPNSIYLTAYPNPSYLEDGESICGSDRSADLSEQARSKIPKTFNPKVWDIQITQGELKLINKGLIDPLYNTMKTAAYTHQWRFIDGHIEQIKSHGICADYARKEKSTPIYPHINKGNWYPDGPWNEWAYDETRVRWFRNTNDSVMFQNDKSDSVMNGAFHPDYRAHAVIADQIYDTVSKIWSEPLPVATK